MTLEELNARITAIEDCYAIAFDMYIDEGIGNKQCEEMFSKLLKKLRESRDKSWEEFSERIHEMSKQA